MTTVEKIGQLIAAMHPQPASKIAATDRLVEDLDLDSLGRLNLIVNIEFDFNIEISDEQAWAWVTVADVAATVEGKVIA